jgi:hypothetical protein
MKNQNPLRLFRGNYRQGRQKVDSNERGRILEESNPNLYELVLKEIKQRLLAPPRQKITVSATPVALGIVVIDA